MAMHEDPVARLDQNIIQRSSSECVVQVDAKDSCGPIRLPAEKLRRVQPRIRCYASGLKNHIAQMLLSRRAITPRRADFAGDEHFGIRLKVEPPEDAHRIERFKLRCLFGV